MDVLPPLPPGPDPHGTSQTPQARGGRLRVLTGIMISLMLANFSIGILAPLIALTLERQGVTATLNGLNAAVPAIALFVLTFFLPHGLRAVGPLRALYIGLAVWVAASLAMAVLTGLGAWFALRFLLALGVSLHWVVGETWINTASTDAMRGRVVGLYMTLTAMSLAAGPLCLDWIGIDGWPAFALAAGAAALAAFALVPVHGSVPPELPEAHTTLGTVLRMDPLAMTMAFVAGFCDTAVIALLPVYGVQMGLPLGVTLALLAIFLGGNALLQIPIGWLTDRIDRRVLITGCAAISVIGALWLPGLIELETRWPLWIVVGLWGGAQLGLYTLGLVRLGHRFRRGQLPGANAAFALMYGVGMFFGPVAGGAAMDVAGPQGLPGSLAVAAFVLLAVAVWHWFLRERPTA